MNKNADKQKFINKRILGNFTKSAVENFEENIVNQRDFLEKVKDSETSRD